MSRSLLPEQQWQRVKALFDEAQLLAPAERAGFVAAATHEAVVRDEVLALLAACDATDGFLEQPTAASRFEVGQRIGPYEIRGLIGSGGMGEVYRARDTRLLRDVAVKVLRLVPLDAAGRARLEREARAIAALSHPNVLAIHDVGEEAGVPYLVTELLEGQTLRERLRRGPPPLPQALAWARQIALALAAAHQKGIVHRDLKPENVFVVDEQRIKVLDFGLARLLPEARTGNEDESRTLPGLIVGTAGYLSPEQAHGKPAGATADIFALGAILHELITGARAFKGDNVLATLRAVLEHEPPPPSTIRPDVPPSLDRVVARCLNKEPAARFQSAHDLAFVLEAPAAVQPGSERRRWRVLVGMALGALAAAAAVGVLWPKRASRGPAREPPQPRPLTFSGRDRAPAVSLDGRYMAFASERDGRWRIWLQELDSGRESALTDGLDYAPRFSPDAGQVLFTRTQGAKSDLYRVGLISREVRKVVDDASDGDWSPDGRSVAFVRWRPEGTKPRHSVMVADIDGSGQRELTQVVGRVLLRPRWSPDGSRIAVTGLVHQPGMPQTIVLVPIDGTAPRELPAPSPVGMVSAVAWDGPRTLLYSQALSVLGNSAGSPARVVRQRVDDGTITTWFWTPNNSLVLDRWPGRGVVFDARSARQNLHEVGLAAGKLGAYLTKGTATDRQPRYSPDGERVLFSSNRSGNLDLWVMGRRDGSLQRLTDDPADDWDGSFTPDGKKLLWSSNRSGNFEVWQADADGAHQVQVTHDGLDAGHPSATPDGQWVVFSSAAPGRAGVWRIRPDGSHATLIVPDAGLPEVSPDGRWVLFQRVSSPMVTVIGVARLADGQTLPYEIRVGYRQPTAAILGRASWMPDGRTIAFVGQDDRGTNGVFELPFVETGPPEVAPTPVAGFDSEHTTETFAVAPAGDQMIVAEWELRSHIVAATGLAPD